MVSGETKYELDDFELYQAARDFRKKIYRLIKLLRASERYCLEKQMRRAAVSITNNIAEGHGRWHVQENIQFCRVARGSIEEIMDDINICTDESFADKQLLSELKGEAYQLIHRLNGYVAYLRSTQRRREA